MSQSASVPTLYHVTKEWIDGSFIPQLSEFKNVNKVLRLKLDATSIEITHPNGYVQKGFKMAKDRFYLHSDVQICQPPANVQMRYHLSGGAAGSLFNIFKDGMAEIITFGSGRYITHVDYGRLL